MTVEIHSLQGGALALPRDVPFNASDYTAKGAMTWTVTSASSRVQMLGNNVMMWWLGIDTAHSVLGGVANNQIFIKIPFNRTLSKPGFSTPTLVTHITGALYPETDVLTFGDFDNQHITIIRPAFANYALGTLLVSIQPIIFEVS